MTRIDSKIPEGPVAEKWTNYKAHQKLVNPANKRRLDIIVVGTGLAGASAAASLTHLRCSTDVSFGTVQSAPTMTPVLPASSMILRVSFWISALFPL